uniref:MYND-type domain-containing protein n=1 Tax=Hanusia phi TaxID=3032 RepID=A0A7S0E0T3_9CRYP
MIVDPDYRLSSLQEVESKLTQEEAEYRSWRLCTGNKMIKGAKRPRNSFCKARECSYEQCGMYTLLCEFKQCAGCATLLKKRRYCNRACQKRDWVQHRISCGWFGV